jgi:nucleotide-binding universal stress UspA family protein
MPVLRAAEAVEVLSVAGEKDVFCPGRGARALPRTPQRDVAVTTLAAEDGDVAETRRSQAIRSSSDLIVMGAYKHSRLREWLLGGVTQSLLKSSPVPLFMSY